MSRLPSDLKRDIFDGFRLGEIIWHGELSQSDFLSRIFDLKSLPSNDVRYADLESDHNQHCVINSDWDFWWIINDSRLDLDQDKNLKKFLVEMTNPVVHPETKIALQIVSHVNNIFATAGLPERMVQIKTIWDKPVFDFRITPPTVNVEMEQESAINGTFAEEQVRKCREKLESGDYDGAVTNSRSFLEGVFDDLHKKVAGVSLPESGDLTKDFKKIQRLLNLSPEQHSSDAAKGLISGLIASLQGIDVMSNKMGDRHRPIKKAERHHAKLCVDSAITISDFLYSSIAYQHGTTVDLYERLVKILDSELRLCDRNKLLENKEVMSIVRGLDEFTARILLVRFIDEFEIPTRSGFRKNDIFFAVLRILRAWMKTEDLKIIFNKHKGGSQTVGLQLFLQQVAAEVPEVHLSSSMLKYAKDHILVEDY